MKKLFLLAFCFASTGALAEQLHNYDQIKAAVADGKQIRIYLDYSKCSTSSKLTNAPDFSGAFTPNEIGINNAAGYIAASLNHFTLNDPQFPGQPVYEFTRYTVASDGTLTLNQQTLKAADYSVLTDKITFTCKLDETYRVYA